MSEQDEAGLEAFQVCRGEVKHEYDVLTGRLTTYITSQSFLVSAYAVAMNNPNATWGTTFRLLFPSLVCFAGILLTLQAYPGISGVCRIIQLWHDQQGALLERHPHLKQYQILHLPEIAGIYRRSLTFAQVSPWIFGLAWIAFGALAIALPGMSR